MVKAYLIRYNYNGGSEKTITYDSLENFIDDWTDKNASYWNFDIRKENYKIFCGKNPGDKKNHVRRGSVNTEVDKAYDKDYGIKTEFFIRIGRKDNLGRYLDALHRLDVDGVCYLNNSDGKTLITNAFIEKVMKPIEDKINRENDIQYADDGIAKEPEKTDIVNTPETPDNNHSNKDIDSFIEQMQANSGMSEHSMEREIEAAESIRPDYLDKDGNPRSFDEEEEETPLSDEEVEWLITNQKLKDAASKNLMSWANQSTFDEADGLDGAAIFEKYENRPVPIAVLPVKALAAFNNVHDRNLYSGKAYFIDHMVNHHDEVDVSEYKSFQDDLDNFNKIYSDPKNGSIVFERDKNNKKYSIAVKEDEEGHLVFYKSYHFGDKTKKRFIELDLEKLEKEKSVEVGSSSISHSAQTESGSLLSALTDNVIIPQPQEKSNENNNVASSVVVDGKTVELKHGLEEGFRNAYRKLDKVLAANESLVKENEKLRRELSHGQGRK